ncbi:MAG: alkaline phosphatase [Halochromatium sp.]|nr:alkaline phosphatase [Halochromatium sp.]
MRTAKAPTDWLSRRLISLSLVALPLVLPPTQALAQSDGLSSAFERIATFPIYRNLAPGEDPSSETAAEIIASAQGGTLLVYSDSPMERIGFIDIQNPSMPQPAGFFPLDGEPTSVAVLGDYALVGVNTSASYTEPSGYLAVIDIADTSAAREVARIDLGGQPDSVAISPDGRYAAIAIENERDEDACARGDGTLINEAHGDEDRCDDEGGEFGGLPQLPAGYLSLVDLAGDPTSWQADRIDLTGLAAVAPIDPEPEYVAINSQNQAAVSLQENNHLVVVDLLSATVASHFSAGTVNLTNVDTVENDLIDPIYSLNSIPREPDAVAWVADTYIATANEGDWNGGSRGYSLFTADGTLVMDAGERVEYATTRVGQYPEFRAENKGAEPEGVAAASYGNDEYLFVGAERANLVLVEKVIEEGRNTETSQLLPTGVAPEGLLPIPSRNLFVIAAEADAADDNIRSLISLYQLSAEAPEYPQLASTGEPPIGWGALSALAADRNDASRLYSVHDNFYAPSHLYSIDLSETPAQITQIQELRLGDETRDYDLEGLATRAEGGFWAVSEGNANTTGNLLIPIAADGTILDEISLPTEIADEAVRFGFEGVAVIGAGATEQVFVAFQREWADDPEGYVKIGRYLPSSQTWDFYYYPLDPAPEGAWVGLSEIVTLDELGVFAVVERDNQLGPDASVKRIYQIALDTLQDQGLAYPVFRKTLMRDLLPDLQASNGWVPDKVEGMAVTIDGQVYLVTDNDGIDDALGETYFLRLGLPDASGCNDAETRLTWPVASGTQTNRSEVGISVAGTVSVASAAALELFAPRIHFLPGFSVADGGQLLATASTVNCTADL